MGLAWVLSCSWGPTGSFVWWQVKHISTILGALSWQAPGPEWEEGWDSQWVLMSCLLARLSQVGRSHCCPVCWIKNVCSIIRSQPITHWNNIHQKSKLGLKWQGTWEPLWPTKCWRLPEVKAHLDVYLSKWKFTLITTLMLVAPPPPLYFQWQETQL
jgi:hypothetical protein